MPGRVPLDRSLAAADEEKWDAPIVESMEVAYAFAGPKTQTPAIVVRSDPPHGFKGPVMSPAPTGNAALRMRGRFVMTLSRRSRASSNSPGRRANPRGAEAAVGAASIPDLA